MVLGDGLRIIAYGVAHVQGCPRCGTDPTQTGENRMDQAIDRQALKVVGYKALLVSTQQCVAPRDRGIQQVNAKGS